MYVLCFICKYCFSFGFTYEVGALPCNISVFIAVKGLYLALVIRFKYTSLSLPSKLELACDGNMQTVRGHFSSENIVVSLIVVPLIRFCLLSSFLFAVTEQFQYRITGRKQGHETLKSNPGVMSIIRTFNLSITVPQNVLLGTYLFLHRGMPAKTVQKLFLFRYFVG